ncbi:MAG: type II toxin-antitoxin system RelE/ParE family toxin [Planctomycetes bacterium]|nr:type II toxin-antitoxin system RelE/ParE family toxin [Planctomycetota bacterium]
MAYTVEFTPHGSRDFRGLPRDVQGRMAPKIDALANNPFPAASTKLVNTEDEYRLRVGDYRVIYQVKQQRLLVLVVKIAHRREVYRNM